MDPGSGPSPDRPPRAAALSRAAADGLAVGLTLICLLWVCDIHTSLGWVIYTEQFIALALTLSLTAVFLGIGRDGKPRVRLHWHDPLAALLALGSGLYVTLLYPTLVDELVYDPMGGLPVAIALMLLLLEALRRTSGPAIAVIAAIFLLYGLLGHFLPQPLQAQEQKPERLLTQLMIEPTALLGLPLNIAATVVVAFVFFGNLLNQAGGGAFFTDISLALMGRYRGGSAKIAIVASSLFGSISGSAVSNVATTGVVTIPLMKRGGYPPHTAGAIEAVASTGGQLMPPVMGASAFLVAEFLQIAYSEVVFAALIPGILYYVALFMQADLQAARSGMARVDEALIPPLRRTLAKGWYFPLPFVVLIGALFWLNMEAELAALWATAAVALFGVIFPHEGRRLGPRALLQVIRGTGMAVLDIVMITAAAGIIIGVLNLTGLSFGLTLMLVQLGGGSLLAVLVIAALVSIVLGMGMPTVGVYVLLASLVAPSLVELGALPLAAHMFVLYFGMMSMITPPVAIAAFAAASLSGASPMRTGWAAMSFGWVAYVVPFLFVASPSLLLVGETGAVIQAIATALAGVWLVSAGMAGYFAGPLSAPWRGGLIVAGLLLFIPAGAFEAAIATDYAGAVLGAILVGARLFSARRAAPVAPRGADAAPAVDAGPSVAGLNRDR